MDKITYTFANGEKVEMNDINLEGEQFSFKVNLPSCEKDYLTGNGEGVWVKPSLDAHEDWHKDAVSKYNRTIYYGKILNDSLYYPNLTYGTLIAFELRGENRPVAIYEELVYKYGESQREKAMNDYFNWLKGEN